ncbi:MAG: dual specificity protein phosphatase family protein [Deltaproteobacteria bacterium]|nr:dual specificity protein phosphatase family protein [Deltaproteobacteria bacterium]MCK5708963.1 dual specificity protein phosphatase family protein [Deltaproteobacteria bacterium]
MPERFSWIIEESIAGMERPGLFYSLEDDLDFLKAKGVEVIVNLQEKEHFLDHDGFIVKNISINDFGTPNYEDFVEFIDFVSAHIAQEKRVVVHCYAGMGRTNLMLATYLVHKQGIHPDQALEEVRLKRPVHLVTYRQEESLREYYYVIRDNLIVPKPSK